MPDFIATNVALHDPALAHGPDVEHKLGDEAHTIEVPPYYEGAGTTQVDHYDYQAPTNEELKTLRRVSSKIKMSAYTIAFVELAERFSFYGTTITFTNYIKNRKHRPAGNAPLGDPSIPNPVAGALGMGAQAAAGITTFNQFWVYVIPLFGAYIADTYLGRYRTIMYSVMIAIVGHIIVVASAAPGVLDNQHGALACFIIGIIIMGVGTGGFKPNISPLVAEQMPLERMHVVERYGKRVIVDPAVTTNRIYNWFYLFINIGALVGQLSMSYTAYYVGFWLAWLLPTIVFLCCPFVLYFCRNMYVQRAPEGSVLGPAFRLWFYAQKGRWSLNPVATWKNLTDGSMWEAVKPSNIAPANRPKWMTFDDAWVDEVRRGFKACKVFLYYPLYWLTYNQLNNNLTSQASVMSLHGIPNDILNNLDPLALIILIPICDLIIYPFLRRRGYNFSPIKRIFWGFMTGVLAMVWALVIQVYIYKELGDYAYEANAADPTVFSPINVWAQTGSYILIAISEILASITSLEYAFSKAPKNMRSLVMSFSLFQTALAAALGEAFNPLSADPLLVWNYGISGLLALIGGILFWFQFRQQDKDDDMLNMLPTGHVGASTQLEEIERRRESIVPQDDLKTK